MLLGVDTGFFISVVNQRPRSIELWNEFVEGKHSLVISTVTVNELFVYFYRIGLPSTAQEWLERMQQTKHAEFIPISIQIAKNSATYRHSLGMATIDSLILATFIEYQCEKVLTVDNAFRLAAIQNIIPVEVLTS